MKMKDEKFFTLLNSKKLLLIILKTWVLCSEIHRFGSCSKIHITVRHDGVYVVRQAGNNIHYSLL